MLTIEKRRKTENRADAITLEEEEGKRLKRWRKYYYYDDMVKKQNNKRMEKRKRMRNLHYKKLTKNRKHTYFFPVLKGHEVKLCTWTYTGFTLTDTFKNCTWVNVLVHHTYTRTDDRYYKESIIIINHVNVNCILSFAFVHILPYFVL